MERHFELELQKLSNRILKMGNLVGEQIHNTMEALLTCDQELAQKIIDNDTIVDNWMSRSTSFASGSSPSRSRWRLTCGSSCRHSV